MELWDAYDRDMKKIENMILFREKGVPDGFYHLVSEILVRHTDGSFLVMQRDMSKHLGGKWEATAGGSALRGETSQDCAKRELAEETGIKPISLFLSETSFMTLTKRYMPVFYVLPPVIRTVLFCGAAKHRHING